MEYSLNWDKSIETQEIQLNYYNTNMIFYENKEIVKNIKSVKYNNIFLNLNVDEIEEDSEIIPK